MTVRFAQLCDRCQVRSEEYHQYPICSDCGEDICRECAATGTLTESEDGERPQCLCHDCQLNQNEPIPF